jgi:hypothetical protein
MPSAERRSAETTEMTNVCCLRGSNREEAGLQEPDIAAAPDEITRKRHHEYLS